MELERLLEILGDREHCEFCPDAGSDNICSRCEAVNAITATELREFYRLVGIALVEQDRRRK